MAAKKTEENPYSPDKNWITGEQQSKAQLETAAKPEPVAHIQVGELKRYIVGLDDKCPIDYLTVPTIPGQGGAFTFQKSIQRPHTTGEGMYALGGPQSGEIIEIFDVEYEKIVTYLKSYGLKRTGSNPEDARPEIVPLKPREGVQHNWREVAQGNIIPLDTWAYIVPAKSVSADDRDKLNRPPTLREMAAATSVAGSK